VCFFVVCMHVYVEMRWHPCLKCPVNPRMPVPVKGCDRPERSPRDPLMFKKEPPMRASSRRRYHRRPLSFLQLHIPTLVACYKPGAPPSAAVAPLRSHRQLSGHGRTFLPAKIALVRSLKYPQEEAPVAFGPSRRTHAQPARVSHLPARPRPSTWRPHGWAPARQSPPMQPRASTPASSVVAPRGPHTRCPTPAVVSPVGRLPRGGPSLPPSR